MTDNNRTATVAPPPVSRLTRAQRRALDARARIEAQRADDQIALERLEARREHMRARAELAAERRRLADEARQARRAAKAQARTRWRTAAAAAAVRLGRRIVLTGTNVGVNGVAVVGQVLALAGVGWPIWAAVAAAVVIESVAIYVGWHAHVALVEGDSAARIRLVSYGIGLAVAWLNYSHNDPRVAWLYAGCSAASPWLWAMHSRHVHRKQLRAEGLIDPRAPKFSALRWALHPAETAAALWWAVGEGIQSPAVAIAAVRGRRHAAAARTALKDGRAALNTAAAAALQLAVELIEDEPDTPDVTGAVTPPATREHADPEVAAAVASLAAFATGRHLFPVPAATYAATPGATSHPLTDRVTDTVTQHLLFDPPFIPPAATPGATPDVTSPATTQPVTGQVTGDANDQGKDAEDGASNPAPAGGGGAGDDDADAASKTKIMRDFWLREVAEGRFPRAKDLADKAGAHHSLASRLRTQWVAELPWRKRKRAEGTRREKATA